MNNKNGCNLTYKKNQQFGIIYLILATLYSDENNNNGNKKKIL